MTLGHIVKAQIQSGRLDTMSSIEYAQRTKPEILVVGSSSAEAGYNSKLFEQRTGLTTLNIGRGSASATYVYIALLEIIKKHQPKVIIYDAVESDLLGKTDNKAVERLEYLYGGDEEIDSLIVQSIPSVWPLYSNTYKYRLLLKNLMRPRPKRVTDSFVYRKPDSAKRLDYDVSVKAQNNNRDSYERYFHDMHTNATVYKSFWSIVDLCEKNEITLIVVVGPKYPWLGIYPQNQLIADAQTKLKEYRSVRLVHASAEMYPVFLDKDLYLDTVHLNGLGADILTSLISDIVMQIKN